ncbi:MAG: HIRAN domain-containing protein [Pseudoxanthomonas suwonensis]|nr:HIRAN domain-containing protein [Pseudoxanthomonas suwonensis]
MAQAEHTDCQLPAGVKARLWMEARCFYSRESAQARCWLWLLRDDGTLVAVHVPLAHLGDDDGLQGFLRELDVNGNEAEFSSTRFGDVVRLTDAPAVPMPRWAISWGHPFQERLRSFATELDVDTLRLLGELEAPGPFLGSVENYNRLASLEPGLRERRTQALKDFPPLVVPLLLRTQGWPSLLPDQYEDRQSNRGHASELTCPPGVLEAIDRGRDLSGALASHYRVARAVVRSAPMRTPWRRLDDVHQVLRVLDAIPAHSRPASAASLEAWWPSVKLLPVPRSSDALAIIGQSFAKGWETTWESTGLAAEQVPAKLRDCRDFLTAAVREIPPDDCLSCAEPDELGLAWLARRGLHSLLRASDRWHAQAMVRAAPQGSVDAPAQLPAILGDWSDDGRHASELLTATALVEEGREMSHCVGGYWNECTTQGDRILRLSLPDGAQATAHVVLAGVDVDGPRYALEDVRSRANAECSLVMWRWAQQVEDAINSPDREGARRQALRHARECASRADEVRSEWVRPFDRASRAELEQVLAWLRTQRDSGPRGDVLLEDYVRGTGHTPVRHHVDELVGGDPLDLVREPTNPHDPAAIRIEWSGRKIGYVSRQSNARLARLLDQGVRLDARLTRVVPESRAWPIIEFRVLAPASRPESARGRGVTGRQMSDA